MKQVEMSWKGLSTLDPTTLETREFEIGTIYLCARNRVVTLNEVLVIVFQLVAPDETKWLRSLAGHVLSYMPEVKRDMRLAISPCACFADSCRLF